MLKVALQKNTEKKICLALVVVLLSLFVSYVYLVSASIVHVVLRTELDQEMQQVQSQISTLESKYIAAQHRVNERIATLDGYTENSNKVFIDRSAPSLVLSSE